MVWQKCHSPIYCEGNITHPLTINWVVSIFRPLPRHINTIQPTLGDEMEKLDRETQSSARSELPDYVKPSIRMMDEKEVLSAFQVTVAAITWWVM